MTTIVPYRNGHGLMPTLLGWDPERVFERLARWEPFGGRTVWSAFASPLRIEEHADGVTATVDLPGVDPDQVELTFDAGTLSICGRRGEQIYRYAVALGDAIDPSTIEAQLDKGVLTIHAGKRAEARPRKILVKRPEPDSSAGGESK